MDDLALFTAAGIPVAGQKWRWHLHGRYLVRSTRGWPIERPHREVWHFDTDCIAATEAEARAFFTIHHGPHTPHHQWLHFFRGSEVKPTSTN